MNTNETLGLNRATAKDVKPYILQNKVGISRNQTEMKLLWGIRLDNVLTSHANTKLKKKKGKKCVEDIRSSTTVALKCN